jgi:hypothetical protein
MKKIYLTAILILHVLIAATSQTVYRCGTEEYNSKLMQSLINNHTSILQAPVYIPVVFHVIYNTAAQQISSARILEQLQVLNNDFQRLNADTINTPSVFQPLAAASEIHFCLAQRDPSGQSTPGILYVQTTQSSFTNNNDVMSPLTGGDTIWNREQYMNVWICNLSNGILGYSSYPGAQPCIDGIVLHYECVGGPNAPGTLAPFNMGRILTHMTGHWLNLPHLFDNCMANSCGPPQQLMATGCPVFPSISCNNGPSGDMFMDFMQGVNDECMNMFCTAQLMRMNLALSTMPRSSLLLSPGCLTVGIMENINSTYISISPNPFSDKLTIASKTNQPLEITLFDITSRKLLQQQFTNAISLNTSQLSKGIYIYELRTKNGVIKKGKVVKD